MVLVAVSSTGRFYPTWSLFLQENMAGHRTAQPNTTSRHTHSADCLPTYLFCQGVVSLPSGCPRCVASMVPLKNPQNDTCSPSRAIYLCCVFCCVGGRQAAAYRDSGTAGSQCVSHTNVVVSHDHASCHFHHSTACTSLATLTTAFPSTLSHFWKSKKGSHT